MNEKKFLSYFFDITGFFGEKKKDVFFRIANFAKTKKTLHTKKRDFLGFPMKKFSNTLPTFGFWNNFWKIIENRKTERNFSTTEKVNYTDIEKLIAGSFGKNRKKLGNFMHRSPSAGGLFAMQGYFINFSVEGLEKGIFYIDENREVLFDISSKSSQTIEELEKNWRNIFFTEPQLFQNTSGVFIFCADFSLSLEKYGLRSLRNAFLDAGHSMQNMCLIGEKLNVKIVPFGGFDDTKLRSILSLNSSLEMPVYTAVLGK